MGRSDGGVSLMAGVVVSQGEDATVQKNGDSWDYMSVGDGVVIVRILDEDDEPIGVEYPLHSVSQIVQVSDEDAEMLERELS